MTSILLVLPYACGLLAQQVEPADKLAPYYPTPASIVRKMLDLGGLKPGEKMFDLGSGDGRIVIIAAQKYKADATGVELDTDLWKQSSEHVRKLKLDKSARIVHGDLLKQDYSSADLITVYLLPATIDYKVTPILERQLKKGTRIVSHDFEFSGWKPAKIEDVEDDGEGRSHRLYLYIR
jgi:16S rRNA A1518/A1519 N6-dimethyltransferase RsmA/KsgA/DIM1 with predicted DNA glycosylase/AP lyase activity